MFRERLGSALPVQSLVRVPRRQCAHGAPGSLLPQFLGQHGGDLELVSFGGLVVARSIVGDHPRVGHDVAFHFLGGLRHRRFLVGFAEQFPGPPAQLSERHLLALVFLAGVRGRVFPRGKLDLHGSNLPAEAIPCPVRDGQQARSLPSGLLGVRGVEGAHEMALAGKGSYVNGDTDAQIIGAAALYDVWGKGSLRSLGVYHRRVSRADEGWMIYPAISITSKKLACQRRLPSNPLSCDFRWLRRFGNKNKT